MRRLLVGAVVVMGVLLPFGVQASDVQDGRACKKQSTETNARTYATGEASEEDRFSVCVKGPNGEVLFYGGGELQSEDERNDGFAGTCGAIIVADTTIAQGAYGEDWDRTSYGSNHEKHGTFHC